jgi:hypothetical protein
MAVCILAVSLAVAPSTAKSCNDTVGGWTATCEAHNDGSKVELGATRQPQTGSDRQADGGKKPASHPTTPPTAASGPCANSAVDCYWVVALPQPRAEDLAAFVPHRPALTVEPDGVGIVGAPTNLVGTVATHTLTGTLFGNPVTVRFTPASYVFDYGDGSTSTTSTGGASWGSLHQAQLTSTPTSHVYRERGTYPVSIRVVYDAAVDWGNGSWIPVVGQVRSIPNTASIRVYEARTALVAHTCEEAPTAPGC